VINIVEIDTSKVQWAKTPMVKTQMRDYIHNAAKEKGLREFGTMTFRCLNGIESPGPDPYPPKGWEYLPAFFHDCEPEMLEDQYAVYTDIRVVAKSL
jgi:hypothetical protein